MAAILDLLVKYRTTYLKTVQNELSTSNHLEMINYTYLCGKFMEIQLLYYILAAILNFRFSKIPLTLLRETSGLILFSLV